MDAKAARGSRGRKSASVVEAWLLGGTTLVMATYVAVGMVVALASVGWRLRRFARGDGAGTTIALFLLSVVLCLVWAGAYAAQHAS
jgi:uncharacterized membrane protein YqjE